MRSVSWIGSVALATAVLGSSAVSAQIVNGGFESESMAPWTTSAGIVASSITSGFTADGGRVAQITFDAFFGAGSGTLSQSFTTASAGQFDYRFAAGQSEAIGPFFVGTSFSFAIDGVVLSTQAPAFDGSSQTLPRLTRLGTDYTGSTFLGAGTHQISFFFARPDTGFGRAPFFVLDGVSVTAAAAPGVPEPASWALMIAGFGLAGASLRTRRDTSPAAARC